MQHVFEVPVFSAAAARTAVENGATRLEINRAASYADGGLTPTLAEVEAIRHAVDAVGGSAVPLRVMIRPRGPPAHAERTDSTDFVYAAAEFQQMLADLQAFAASGLLSRARGDGFVFGVLEPATNALDAERNRLLVHAARAYACVLHRAFDVAVDAAAPHATLARAHAMGFAGVLTAGGPGPQGAVAHVGTLRQLAAAAVSSGVEVIVGGGVRSANIRALADGVLDSAGPGANVAFHSSCLADAAAAVRDGAAGEVVDGAEVGRIRDFLCHQ